jgi:hypothetical protein
MERSLGKRQ